MAAPDTHNDHRQRSEMVVQFTHFYVSNLFGYLNHKIEFPQTSSASGEPEILIVEGPNGSGKTTILKMIGGITKNLNFDQFRQVPFEYAELGLSTGDLLTIRYNKSSKEFPLIATFRNHTVQLAAERDSARYSTEQARAIEAYRSEAMPLLRGVDFELLTIDRSIEVETKSAEMIVDHRTGALRPRSRQISLGKRVLDFLRDAQVNYRRFFKAEELELLPRILRQFAKPEQQHSSDALLQRIFIITDNDAESDRFGLQTDQEELKTLTELLRSEEHKQDIHALTLLASYIDTYESRSAARNLLALRLSLFESIMDDFFVGKKVRVSVDKGLVIESRSGELSERDLSSGEFHFLYMMVAALLCERIGSIIAIDEPELSLHVSWQRRLINALSKCASGASPLFVLCTHSTSISSAHRYAVQTLSAID